MAAAATSSAVQATVPASLSREAKSKPLPELPTEVVTLQITLRHDLQLGERNTEFVGTVVDQLIEDQLGDALADALWESTFFSAKEKETMMDINPEIMDVATCIVEDAEPEPADG